MVTTSQAVKQHYAPLTSLTARAIDLETADKENAKTLREDIVNLALEYLHTDTLLCWAPDVPPSTTFKFGDNKHSGMRNGAGLREIQMQAAQDVVRYLTGNVWPGVSLTPSLQSNSILPTPQPEHTRKTIRNWLWKLPPWELAGLERAVIATKSLLIATRLLVGWADLPATQADRKSQAIFGIDEAARASNIELQWQIDTWGAVEDTHDVNDEDLKRQLGGAVLLMSKDPALPDA